jgi:hypothetical protein
MRKNRIVKRKRKTKRPTKSVGGKMARDPAPSYTLKRGHVAKLGSDGGAEVELRPDNHDFMPMRMRRADGAIRVIAEFLEVG